MTDHSSPFPGFWVKSPRYVQIYLQRFIPASAVATFLTVRFTTAVPPNLILVEGEAAAVVVWGYIAVLVGLAVFPDSLRLHLLGGVLACLTITARALGFVGMIIVFGRGDLYGAVAERFLLLVLLMGWHIAMAARIGLEQPAEPWRKRR